jgi:hypothetical protein
MRQLPFCFHVATLGVPSGRCATVDFSNYPRCRSFDSKPGPVSTILVEQTPRVYRADIPDRDGFQRQHSNDVIPSEPGFENSTGSRCLYKQRYAIKCYSRQTADQRRLIQSSRRKLNNRIKRWAKLPTWKCASLPSGAIGSSFGTRRKMVMEAQLQETERIQSHGR